MNRPTFALLLAPPVLACGDSDSDPQGTDTLPGTDTAVGVDTAMGTDTSMGLDTSTDTDTSTTAYTSVATDTSLATDTAVPSPVALFAATAPSCDSLPTFDVAPTLAWTFDDLTADTGAVWRRLQTTSALTVTHPEDVTVELSLVGKLCRANIDNVRLLPQ